jgi:hypothetical protein
MTPALEEYDAQLGASLVHAQAAMTHQRQTRECIASGDQGQAATELGQFRIEIRLFVDQLENLVDQLELRARRDLSGTPNVQSAELNWRLARQSFSFLRDFLEIDANFILEAMLAGLAPSLEELGIRSAAVRRYTEIDERLKELEALVVVSQSLTSEIRSPREVAMASLPFTSVTGDYDPRDKLNEELKRARLKGDRGTEALLHLQLGAIDRWLGHPQRARPHFDSSLSIAAQMRNQTLLLVGHQSILELDNIYQEPDRRDICDHALEAVRLATRLRLTMSPTTLAQRYDIVFGNTYSLSLEATAKAMDERMSGAGEIALEIAEASKSSALTEVLRSGGIPVGGELGTTLERIVRLETALTDESGELKDRMSGANPSAAGELARLHAELARYVSSEFASALRPSQPDVPAIVAAIQREKCHALIFQVDLDHRWLDRRVGHVVWINPSGAIRIDRIIADHEIVDLLRQSDTGSQGLSAVTDPVLWEKLATALIPKRLRMELLRRRKPSDVIVVPDQTLARFPFAALRLNIDTPLISRVRFRSVPSMSLFVALVSRPNDGSHRGTVTHLDPDLNTESEGEALAFIAARDSRFGPLCPVENRQRLLQSLSEPPTLWAMGVHGSNDEGLQQSLKLASREVVSAASLLGLRMPEIVSLGSCFGARFPLGIASTCLTQGTRSLLGALWDVSDGIAGEVLADTYRNLLKYRPAEALRRAQVSFVDRNPDMKQIDWAALVSVGV